MRHRRLCLRGRQAPGRRGSSARRGGASDARTAARRQGFRARSRGKLDSYQMKRSLIVLLPLSAAFVLCAADPVPTGESILEKYVAVTGGKPAYEKMRTQITTAVMEFIGKGVKANMTMYHSEGNKSYMVTEIQGIGKMEEGTDGSVVWERSALKGPRVKSGEERAVSLRGADIRHDLRWREYFTKIDVTGIEPIDG